MSVPAPGSLDVFIVAGEESGDMLASGLMAALRAQSQSAVAFRGVGGDRMIAEGLAALFPMEDLTAIGFGAVVRRLPIILQRLRETVEAIVRDPPDVLILVDAPDFTHRVASRVRRRLPDLPIVKYVAPTVWAWRPGRARAMRGSIDHVLALFPFEPEAMARLGGPPTSYVGHPLVGELSTLRPSHDEALRRQGDPPILLVLPGSRRQELTRLGKVFGETIGKLAEKGERFVLVLPTPLRLAPVVEAMTADWPVRPRIVTDPAEKKRAFRTARVALAASGTVTLELALAGVPFAAAYLISPWEEWLARRLLSSSNVILANIVLGEPAVPQFLQNDCRAEPMAEALERLLQDGPERRAQLQSFARLDEIMATGGMPAGFAAAEIVLAVMARKARPGRAAKA